MTDLVVFATRQSTKRHFERLLYLFCISDDTTIVEEFYNITKYLKRNVSYNYFNG